MPGTMYTSAVDMVVINCEGSWAPWKLLCIWLPKTTSSCPMRFLKTSTSMAPSPVFSRVLCFRKYLDPKQTLSSLSLSICIYLYTYTHISLLYPCKLIPRTRTHPKQPDISSKPHAAALRCKPQTLNPSPLNIKPLKVKPLNPTVLNPSAPDINLQIPNC